MKSHLPSKRSESGAEARSFELRSVVICFPRAFSAALRTRAGREEEDGGNKSEQDLIWEVFIGWCQV